MKGGDGRCLSPAFVLEAPLAWNTAQRKFPDREICRLQGPWGRLGLGLFLAAAGKRGWVSASRAGGGSPPSLAVREQALGASGADSFLSRAGGPRDCSPLSGLGGERPKGEGKQEGRPALSGSAGEWEAEHQPFFFFFFLLHEFCWLLDPESRERPLCLGRE